MAFIENMFSLRGRVAVVTGGAGGLPSVIAAAYLKAGAAVSIWGRGTAHPMDEALQKIKAELQDTEGETFVSTIKCHAVTVDTSDSRAVEEALKETEKKLGTPDILLNGVGGNMGKSSFVDTDEAKFMDILKLNLLSGLVTPSKVFARYWVDKNIAGDIINMTSMTSYKALSGVWAYDAAKAGTLNLTEGLAKELAPHNIRVNAIAPGFFIGHQNKALLMDESTGTLTARGQAIIDRTPFGRFGKNEELCGTAIYLASRHASGFVSGVSIPVDGGFLADNI